MDKETIDLLADLLFEAEMSKTTIPPFIDNGHQDMTLEEAYQIQYEVMKRKEAASYKVVGRKIGLTNPKVREKRGIYEPDYGLIYDKDVMIGDQTIKVQDLIGTPSIEFELAFILKEDLKGPGVSSARVIQASSGVMPAIEIVERRFYPLTTHVYDSICDNAAFGKLILGSKLTPLEGLDLKTIGLIVERNGELIDASASAIVYGDPAASAAWLVNKLSEFGQELKRGDIILSGSISSMHDIHQGDCFYGFFGNGIGMVKAVFR